MIGQIVVIAMVVDTENEAAARAILADVAYAAGAEAADVRWQPYPKLGPHSKVTAALRLPGVSGNQAVIDECERFAALVIRGDSLASAYVNSFLQDDGALFYNRIFDARTSAFLRPDVLWLDLEAHTHPGRQAQLAALFS
jgi:hypothetical protein